MKLDLGKSRLLTPRILLLGLSFFSMVVCIFAGAAHYRHSLWGDVWQPVAWLLSMLFLLLAFLPHPRGTVDAVNSLVIPKPVFFLLWIVFFIVSHLWNFRTAPWNGNGLFDESGWDLWYLKSFVIGHPYQPAWFHFPISRETLFHYYVWGFLKLFGFNILSYETALFLIWLTIFVFTLLLVHLFFKSYVITSVTALILNFLPFAFIYTFAGYRYPMATALAMVSLYFLHLGFRTQLVNTEQCSHGAVRGPETEVQNERSTSHGREHNMPETRTKTVSCFYLSLAGIAAGLCLASSISGKQYLLAILIAAPVYALAYGRSLTRVVSWTSLGMVAYGFVAAATPILLYIVFNQRAYTYYESNFVRDFWHAFQTAPFPNGIRPYIDQFRNCFLHVPAQRFFIPDTLPIPISYYWLLVPGTLIALWQKRFEIVLLAIIPVAGAFIAKAYENRLLLAIPFWVLLMSFTFAGVLRLRSWPVLQIVLGIFVALITLNGLVPSCRYIYSKTKSPYSIYHYAQNEVAVSRFLRHVVAGQGHPGPPHLERDEFNRIEGIPGAAYDTFVCPRDAYSIIHLFLHDYDDAKALSFCSETPFFVMTEQEVWNANKKSILNYVPNNKDLKLIWERDPRTERIIRMFHPLAQFGSEDSLSFVFGERARTFHVLNIPNKNVREFQDRVRALPATLQLSSMPDRATTMFVGGKGIGKGQFDSPSGVAVDRIGNILVADTGNRRIEKFTPTGSFLSVIPITSGEGHLAAPNGLAVDMAGNVYVADAGNHRVQKLAPDGKLIAEWKGPDPGFYGPRRLALGSNNSIYVVDQGRTRIAKLSTDGQLLSVWGSKGSGDGQFDDPTSIAVDPDTSQVYVADPRNRRIQVFDSDGKFLNKWPVAEWGRPQGFEDLAIDSKSKRLYASSANMNKVLIFDLSGNKLGSLTAEPPHRLEGPSALALVDGKLYVVDMVGNRVTAINVNRPRPL